MGNFKESDVDLSSSNDGGMTVAFFIPHLGLGGAQKIAAFVMNELSLAGVEVIAVANYATNEIVDLSESVQRIYLGVNPACERGRIFKKIVLRAKGIVGFVRILKKLDANCFVMFGPDPLSNLAFTLSRKNGYLIECERGDLHGRGWPMRQVLKWYMKHCDCAVFQTEGARDRYGKCLPAKVAIIPNPCDLDMSSAKRENVNCDKIVAAGRLVPEKGFEVLLRSFATVVAKYPDKKLIIYGDGPCASELKNLSQDLGIVDNVTFFGPVADLPLAMQDASMFVLSSEYEGIPNVLIEAMSLGIPVVSTDCAPGGARFLTENGTIGGPVVPVGDENALASAMLDMIEDSGKADKLGQSGKRIREKYSSKVVSARWLKIFKEASEVCAECEV